MRFIISVSYSIWVAKKVLILGSEGMLGSEMLRIFSKQPQFEVMGTQRRVPEKNFFKAGFSSPEKLIKAFCPDIVINCLGVVKQSKRQNDLEQMMFINGEFPLILSRVAANINCKMIHISTDCVFSGAIGDYTENMDPDPIDRYGETKLVGEESSKLGAMVLRTSIIGLERNGTQNGLLSWFLNFPELQVPGFSNAFFSGLTTSSLSKHILQMILDDLYKEGIWHVSSYKISKFELLQRFKPIFRPDVTIMPYEHPSLDRSLDDTHFRSRFGLVRPSWDEMLRDLSEEDF